MKPEEINKAIAEHCRVDDHDYCRDLNAMAGARKTLNADQRVEFIDWLRSDSNSYTSLWDLVDAPAAKQAEAFLRAAGKWKD